MVRATNGMRVHAKEDKRMLISRRDWLWMTAVNGLACLAVTGRAAAGQSAARPLLTTQSEVGRRESRILAEIRRSCWCVSCISCVSWCRFNVNLNEGETLISEVRCVAAG